MSSERKYNAKIWYWLGGVALTLIATNFLLEPIGRMAGHNAAIDVTSREAKTKNMPDGILGVRLLSSPKQLQRIRPNVQSTPHGWMENVEWNRANFRAIYHLDERQKYVLMITLQRPSDGELYRTKQAELNRNFGPLSTPSRSGDMLFYSDRSAGGVTLFHSLIVGPNSMMVEQIALYKQAGT